MITKAVRILAAAALLVTSAAAALAGDVYLRAEVMTLSLPCGLVTTCWGFARDSAAGAQDGVPSVPGPAIVLATGDTSLNIHLTNNLPADPVSVVLKGQLLPTNAGGPSVPVRLPAAPPQPARVRSFVHEAAPAGGTATYSWTGLRPGTFLYASGTHQAVQVQMGLFGALTLDAAPGQAYPGVAYDAEVLLVYHEIDTVLHDAVATGNYGPGKAVSSTAYYAPDYFLVNGKPNSGRIEPLAGAGAGLTTLVRFVNAGLKTHVPAVNRLRMAAVAEDGYPHPYAQDLASLHLPAQATADVLLKPTVSGLHAVYDRRLYLANFGGTQGGLLKHLALGVTYTPADINGDGAVNWMDTVLLLADLGTVATGCTVLPADLDADGTVTWADYAILAASFGVTNVPLP